MPTVIGSVEALFRYPVKSMAGERLEVAELGWHGIDGDRRVAVHRTAEKGGMPWLTATRLPELILFAPQYRGSVAGDPPTHVRTPEGEELALFGDELAADIGRRHGAPVQLMRLRHGIFDETSVSVISSATVAEVGRLAAQPPDVRRFRPNILVDSPRSLAFEEDEWIGGVLSFGEGRDSPAIAVTMRDERCAMVNLDPEFARVDADVLKAVVRLRQNKVGVYATVLRCGRIEVGQPIHFEPV